ncbi:hypothetical protein ACWEOR_22795, partial [Micromonospora chalcea]
WKRLARHHRTYRGPSLTSTRHAAAPQISNTHLEEARQLIAARRKSTAVVLGNLALASILHRDVDAATSHLRQTIEVIERTRAGGGLNLAFAAARQLRPWRDLPSVEDVNDRLFTLMTR